MVKTICFTGKDACAVLDRPHETLASEAVRVRTLVSLVSTGTETIVLGRKFAPGTHWDRWVTYPFCPGYSVIGEVIECGPQVRDLQPGQRVALRKGHAAEHVADAAACLPVPDGLDPREAAWFALAKIAFMGVRAAAVGLGASVLVIGGGPIGQMVVRWCAAVGANRIVLVDRWAQRMELARSGGATAVLPRPVDQATDEIERECGGRPGIVIDSTGNASVFGSALSVAADRGTVVLLGDTGHPGEQHLTSDVITRGLRVVGAHDCHTDSVWTEQRIVGLFFSLLARRRIEMDGMNSHVFRPDQAAEAYALSEADRAGTMGLLFDWS